MGIPVKRCSLILSWYIFSISNDVDTNKPRSSVPCQSMSECSFQFLDVLDYLRTHPNAEDVETTIPSASSGKDHSTSMIRCYIFIYTFHISVTKNTMWNTMITPHDPEKLPHT